MINWDRLKAAIEAAPYRDVLEAERDRYRDALEEAAAVLGTGECSQIKCEGCQWEMGEAVRVIAAALAPTSNQECADEG